MSRREYFKEENRMKNIAVTFSVVLVMTVVAFSFIFNLYNKKLRENARNSLLELGSINAVVPNQVPNENVALTPTSVSNDKGINEVKNEIVNKHEEQKIVESIKAEKSDKNETKKEAAEVKENQNTENEGYVAPAEENYEPNFIAPVSGEIIKDYAEDSLVYSKTLDEWTTHCGIDIRADKMTVVYASETGVVESIKNDPRYRTYNYCFTP